MQRRNLMKTSLRQLVWGLALSVCLPAAMAQTVTGSISGEVKDQSGAVVSGAQVTAHNLDTDVDTSAQTNSDGVYHIEFLPIGHYQVSVKATGFNREALSAFSLEALQTATSNPAKFLGREASAGSVAQGKVADLVLLTANPLDDIRNTAKINVVVAAGRIFDRAALDAMLKQVEVAAKKQR